MASLGYQSCKADPVLWLKPIRQEDGVQYYSFLLCYVDDILCIHHSEDSMLERLYKSFPLKSGIWQSRNVPMCKVMQDQVTQLNMGMGNETC